MNGVCIFCRQKIYYQNLCITCIEGFRDWILNNIKFQHFETSELKSTILFGLGSILGDMSRKNKNLKPFTRYTRIKKWPGFYCGGGKWKIPKVDVIVENENITIYNISDILENKLRENGIFIYEEVHIYQN